MFRGLANLNLVAEDMPAAVAWYSSVFDGAVLRAPRAGRTAVRGMALRR